MAREWYLLSSSTSPNVLSGFENEAFNNYKDDAFYESLDTDIASDVILYNSDLSESKNIRCIIHGNTADTQLKSIERIGLFPRGTVKAGMYIFFENVYWLIDGYPGTQGIYEKATMVLCQYCLRWQNAIGEIIERWCNITSASKYDVGENGNNSIIFTTNNYTIKIPSDEETLYLDEMRVFIDKKNNFPTKVFKLTRNDDVLCNYGDKYHGSILCFIATKTELNLNTDNQSLRICDYHNSESNNLINFEAVINGSHEIRIGRRRIWTVTFFKDGEVVEFNNYSWNVISNFNIEKFIVDNTIKLQVNDKLAIGNKIKIQILINDNLLKDIEVIVKEGY